ncbi:MAG TPA: HAD family hydrolase [Sphingomonas sp.]|nr:HAD family hydrolase [Sphingomonas sp.]
MAVEPRSRTVVFDLDDTLFAERDYVRSGMAAVAALVEQLNGEACPLDTLPEADPLDAIRRRAGLPETALEALLWTYRLHRPTITLRPGAAAAIAGCRRRGEAVAVLTDGRAVTQRLKLAALGLDLDGIFISEELGATKPSDIGFGAVERALPAASYVYVADNPEKDFLAPNARGWWTIGLGPLPDGIHACDLSELPSRALPMMWAADFGNVAALLAGDQCALRSRSSRSATRRRIDGSGAPNPIDL